VLLLCVLFLVVFVFCVCIYFRGVVVVLWLLVCFLACYCTLTCDPCATAAPMARSSTTAACALAGATDHTLSERSWEQKVLFWRTSLKGWCEDPEVDCQPMVRTQQWIRLRVPATGIRMHKFHAPDAQVPCTRSGLPANGTTVLSPIWPRAGSQSGNSGCNRSCPIGVELRISLTRHVRMRTARGSARSRVRKNAIVEVARCELRVPCS
jgi:hypothetical protein